MLVTDGEMESRVKNLEDGMRGLRDELTKLKDALNTALLGSLDGKPGIMATLQALHESRKQDTVKIDKLAVDIDGLRLDRAKVAGIIVAVTTLLGLVYKFFLK